MATVEMGSARGRNSARAFVAVCPAESRADRFFVGAAMGGAVLGAVGGAAVAAMVGSAFPVICGAAGVLAGSGVAAVVGRYALLPLWAAFFPDEVPRA